MSLIVHLMCNPSGERELTAKPQDCNNGDAHGEPLNRALHRLTNQTASCSLFPRGKKGKDCICLMKSEGRRRRYHFDRRKVKCRIVPAILSNRMLIATT